MQSADEAAEAVPAGFDLEDDVAPDEGDDELAEQAADADEELGSSKALDVLDELSLVALGPALAEVAEVAAEAAEDDVSLDLQSVNYDIGGISLDDPVRMYL
ncbi:MAG TPA: hypothetical protein VFI22_09970, partial [Thermomicrobiales bacterium]|nr:hypothetical protein [Thermomicrobiales bacterium]